MRASLTQECACESRRRPRSTIANLESGVGNPSLTVLVKVANALACPDRRADRCAARQGAALAGRRRGDAVARSRRDDCARSCPSECPEELLTLMDFAPGASMRGTPHLPGTREFFTCLAGRVTIFVVGERFDLAEGDVLGFPGNVAHSYQNADPRVSRRAASRSSSSRRPACNDEHRNRKSYFKIAEARF